MGRRPQGWRIFSRAGWLYLRFTWRGADVRLHLGTRDPGEASAAAAREYAAVVSGRRVIAAGKRRSSSLGLEDLIVAWVESLEGELDPETIKTCTIYGRKYLAAFGELDAITPAGVGNYVRARLRQVTRSTLLKERVFLRRFLRWCAERGHIDALPEFPELPKRAPGRRVGPQRSAPVEVTAEDIAEILDALPEESKRIGGRRWPVSGLAYLLGHTQLSTTNRYLRPSRRRAAEALRKAGGE